MLLLYLAGTQAAASRTQVCLSTSSQQLTFNRSPESPASRRILPNQGTRRTIDWRYQTDISPSKSSATPTQAIEFPTAGTDSVPEGDVTKSHHRSGFQDTHESLLPPTNTRQSIDDMWLFSLANSSLLLIDRECSGIPSSGTAEYRCKKGGDYVLLLAKSSVTEGSSLTIRLRSIARSHTILSNACRTGGELVQPIIPSTRPQGLTVFSRIQFAFSTVTRMSWSAAFASRETGMFSTKFLAQYPVCGTFKIEAGKMQGNDSFANLLRAGSKVLGRVCFSSLFTHFRFSTGRHVNIGG